LLYVVAFPVVHGKENAQLPLLLALTLPFTSSPVAIFRWTKFNYIHAKGVTQSAAFMGASWELVRCLQPFSLSFVAFRAMAIFGTSLFPHDRARPGSRASQRYV
jgi:hypothetical protein